MLWAGWGSILPTRQLVIYREYTCQRTKVSTWATEIGKLSRDEKVTKTVLCASAWQERGEDDSIAKLFQKYSGLIPQLPINDRLAGKVLLQEYLRWRQKPKTIAPLGNFDSNVAEKILRVKGAEAYQEYCTLYKEELPEQNLPKLLVFPQCKKLRETIPLCVLNDEEGKSGPPEDVREFNGDDPYDGLRYLTQEANRYIETENYIHDVEIKKTEVSRLLEIKQIDMTSFYRKMEFLQAQDSNKRPRAVRRFHNAAKSN
jgi:hypothetical protein